MSQFEPARPAQAAAAEGDYLSVAQVARRLGCSVSLVQKWRRLGWLPATRLGPPDVPVYGYRQSDVAQFVQERWNRRRGRPPGSGGTSAVAGGVAGPRPHSARPPVAAPQSVTAPVPVAAAGASSGLRMSDLSGRPLVLWDGDPHGGTALVLARFTPADLDGALRIAEAWARRYGTLALGELPSPGGEPRVLVTWRDGQRQSA